MNDSFGISPNADFPQQVTPPRAQLQSQVVDRAHIIAEIRRTGEANGGTPLGRSRFEAETGIREHDWRGRYWARWSDAVVEAGLPPNTFQRRRDEDEVLASLIDEIRRRHRMPTLAELQLRRHDDPSFPSARVFEVLGPKRVWATRVAEYCHARPDYEDVLALLASNLTPDLADIDDQAGTPDSVPVDGFVYLLKSGRHFKIGRTLDVGRRRYDLAIQLPEPITEEHVIRTDDPAGIERYWHDRFASRRVNGEWFDLTRDDVKTFKRRKFM